MENGMDKKDLARYLLPMDVWALSLGCIIGWDAFVMPGTTFLPVAGPLGTIVGFGYTSAAADAGMQGHIAKPLDVEKMLGTISEVLARKNHLTE